VKVRSTDQERGEKEVTVENFIGVLVSSWSLQVWVKIFAFAINIDLLSASSHIAKEFLNFDNSIPHRPSISLGQ
jgi:hypothetical protein